MSASRSSWDQFLTPAETWQDDAVCAQVDPELFFPEKGQSSRPAKALCQSCPVIERCLQFALDGFISDGVYGGLSPRQRRRLQQERAESVVA